MSTSVSDPQGDRLLLTSEWSCLHRLELLAGTPSSLGLQTYGFHLSKVLTSVERANH